MKPFLRAASLALCTLTLSVIASSALAQDPAVVGQWSLPVTWPFKSVHASVLPNRKVMWWPSFANGDNPTMWDPATNTNTALAHAGVNIFCSGHALLPGGNLLVAGGHIGANFVGLQTAFRYSYSANTWTQLPDMNDGRWYPTCTILPPNGDIVVTSGFIGSGNVNQEPQVWQTATSSWRNLTSAHMDLPFYPFMFVAANGKVFCAGPDRPTQYLDVSGTGDWTFVDNSNFGVRNWGSAVMYSAGKVLLMGGSHATPYDNTCTFYPTATAEIIDLAQATPTWTPIASMLAGPARKLFNATILADGKVFVSGGSRGCENPNSAPDFVSECEVWDPVTGSWTLMAPLTKRRGYHSIAVLLPDGRVLSGGGEQGGPSAEIYSPPYLFKGARPTITLVPASVTYGTPFTVTTPDAISKVTMIGLSSVTHGFNMGQRIARPPFTKQTGQLTITVPANPNSNPPGYYILFILNSNGVPSVGKIVHLTL